MTNSDIGRKRLVNQHVARPSATHPHEVVHWLGAVQAQDYLGALWAIGLRTRDATEHTIEQALAEKKIVRTWPMRGTIHFVPASEVRWMLELLAPRVVQRSQGRLRQLGLDAEIIAASGEVIGKALAGGKQRTRNELYNVLEAAGIATSEQRGLHILGQLAHQGLVCFGVRAGKQPTFVLLQEWAPEAKSLPRDEALATLAVRYFTSHGPAAVQDFIWWAGLTATDAKAGLAAVAAQLESAQINGQQYYAAGGLPAAVEPLPEAFLLPPFDEYLIAYQDRSASLDPKYNTVIVPSANGIFSPIVVIDGWVKGTWKRVLNKSNVVMTFRPFDSWSETDMDTILNAARRYANFVGKDLVVEGWA